MDYQYTLIPLVFLLRGINDTRYWLKEKTFSMLLKKSLYFFNKPLSLYQQGIPGLEVCEAIIPLPARDNG